MSNGWLRNAGYRQVTHPDSMHMNLLSLKKSEQMVKAVSKRGSWITWSLHAIGWIIIVIIPLYLHNAYGGGNVHRLYEFYVRAAAAGIIFYVGYLWLVPVFFLKDRGLLYILLLLGLILATFFISWLVEKYWIYDPAESARFQEAIKNLNRGKQDFKPPMKAFGLFSHFLSSFLLSGFALGLGVMEKLKQNEKRQKEMEQEKLSSELAFLKNQVSPHFFFNTLNNIYSLIGIDGPTAQDSVLKLSKMMRYLLYESEHGETLMSHELQFMNNYIDLMKLRLSPKVDLEVDFPDDYSDFSIPPLLFIPFIENAFKHGVAHREASRIIVQMKIGKELISFKTENGIGQTPHAVDLQHSGIGLENVRKRLGLLFPGKHELKIDRGEKVFKVELTIIRG